MNGFARTCSGLADNAYGCKLCHAEFNAGTSEHAVQVKRELQSIAYGWVGATRQERIIAGFFLSEVLGSLNYRIVPTTYSAFLA